MRPPPPPKKTPRYDGDYKPLLDAVRASIDGLGQTVRGHVRVSVPTGLGRFFLGDMLLEFAREHPNVTLRVTFNNRVNDTIQVRLCLYVPTNER